MSDLWRQVAPMALLAQVRMLPVRLEDLQIGLFLIEGEVYAIDNLCTHGNACLTEGTLEGHLVECPLHAGLVDLRTGRPAGAPITRESRIYPVKVEDGHVFINIVASAVEADGEARCGQSL